MNGRLDAAVCGWNRNSKLSGDVFKLQPLNSRLQYPGQFREIVKLRREARLELSHLREVAFGRALFGKRDPLRPSAANVNPSREYFLLVIVEVVLGGLAPRSIDYR